MRLITILFVLILAPAQADADETIPEHQKSEAVFRDCAECPQMVLLPSGNYTMGDVHGWTGARTGPAHKVQIKKFAVGRFEVTRGEFAAFVLDGGNLVGDGCWIDARQNGEWKRARQTSWNSPGFQQAPDHPAVCISWNDSMAYIDWLNEKVPGSPYRLLTESEWEYAARAGTQTDFWWGDRADRAYANYGAADECCRGIATGADKWIYTSPVGRFPANRFGLHDMLGNAYEWVQDCYRNGYGNAPTDGSAVEMYDCPEKVRRGGAWYDISNYISSYHRSRGDPDARVFYSGFRVAKTIRQ